MRSSLCLLVLLLGFLACQSAEKRAAEEFGLISTEDLWKGIQAKTLHVFDNNSPGLYQKKHIPTAVFLDYREPDPKLLPSDKSAPLVFYCKNTRCTASHQGAGYAKSQGYSNARVYALGIDGWEAAGMPTVAIP